MRMTAVTPSGTITLGAVMPVTALADDWEKVGHVLAAWNPI